MEVVPKEFELDIKEGGGWIKEVQAKYSQCVNQDSFQYTRKKGGRLQERQHLMNQIVASTLTKPSENK